MSIQDLFPNPRQKSNISLSLLVVTFVVWWFCKQLRTRSRPKMSALTWIKPFDTLILFLKQVFEKVDFQKKSADDNKAWKLAKHANRYLPITMVQACRTNSRPDIWEVVSFKLMLFSATYNLQQTTISNLAAFLEITIKVWYLMRIVCRQTILMKYHTLSFSKNGKRCRKMCRLLQSWFTL